MKISSKIPLSLTVLSLILETGHCGPILPVLIPSLITLGGVVTCNILGCYSPNGMRKLQSLYHQRMSSDCDDFEYDVDLLIDSHLVMALVPSKEAEDAGCKSFLMHAKYNNKTNSMDKEVVEVESSEIIFQGILEAREHFLPLDNYPFKELSDAFDKATVNADGHDDSFDIVQNNCGDFLAHFLHLLGHKTDEEEMMAITSGLILANPDLPKSMREKVVGTLAENLSDQDLVFSVVKNKMHPMLVE